MAVSWTIIETAIINWFQFATGLPASHVLWANRRQPEPPRPFAKLKRISWNDAGGIGDEPNFNTDLTRPQGQEVEVQIVGRNAFTISCQVFANPVVADAQRTTSSFSERTALDYLSDVKHSLSLPSVIEALNAAGLASIDTGPINDLPEGHDNPWASRAHMDVTFNCSDALSEYIGFIDEVSGSITNMSPDKSEIIEQFEF